MRKEAKRILVCKYFEGLIQRKREAENHSTADLYRATNNWIRKFTKGHIPMLYEITPAFVNKFHIFLKSQKHLKPNSIVSYMCNFRAMYNSAIHERIVHPPIPPFTYIQLHKEKTAKRAISPKEIENLCQLNLAQRSELAFSADLCIFSYLACGMPFVDLAHLNKKNIIGNEIVYNRIKTGTLIRIHITEGMQQLINKYKGKNGPYLFPILKKGEDTTHEEYKSYLANYNTHLKELGKMLNIQIQLTSYVIRHTWATEALRQHIPVAVISQALGHTSEKTTRYYLDQLDQSELDQANALITKSIDYLLRKSA